MRLPLPLLLVVAFMALTPMSVRASEEPAYTRTDHLATGVEIREYAPMLVAEVRIATQDFGEAGAIGFRPLADFIFGSNVRRERIGMTAPVTQGAIDDGWVVGFVMPARYSAETLPLPRDRRIRIVGVPARNVAAIRFSGRWSPTRYAEQLRLLERELAGSAWRPDGEPQSAQYDAPWVPGPMRRNEILLPVQRRE